MAAFAARPHPANGGPLRLALKAAVANGPVRRLLVGDPTVQVLEVLTGLMARLAAETVNAGDHAERIRKAYEWLDVYKNGQATSNEYIEKRRHFYDTLAEIGGNEQLGRIMPTMQIHLLRLQVQPYLTSHTRQDQLRDYAQITEAVLAGKPQQAERAMRRHIRRARARYRRLPDEAFWSQSGAG